MNAQDLMEVTKLCYEGGSWRPGTYIEPNEECGMSGCLIGVMGTIERMEGGESFDAICINAPTRDSIRNGYPLTLQVMEELAKDPEIRNFSSRYGITPPADQVRRAEFYNDHLHELIGRSKAEKDVIDLLGRGIARMGEQEYGEPLPAEEPGRELVPA